MQGIKVEKKFQLKYFLFKGPEGAHLNITWRPKVIDPYKCVRIYFDMISRKQKHFDWVIKVEIPISENIKQIIFDTLIAARIFDRFK